MKASLRGACRGEGLVFARVLIDGCETAGQLFVEAYNHRSLLVPSRACLEGDEAFVVLPLVEGPFLTLVFCAANSTGTVETARMRLSAARVALESKASRLFGRALARQADRFEREHASDWARIQFGVVAPSDEPDMVSVHANVRASANAGRALEVVAFDGRGEPLAQPPIVHTDFTAEHSGASIRTLSLSISASESATSLVLAVRDADDDAWVGFRALEPADYAARKRDAQLMLLDASRDARYHEWFCTQRTSEQELERQRRDNPEHSITFSIIVALRDSPMLALRRTVASIAGQSYGAWELLLAQPPHDSRDLTQLMALASAGSGRARRVAAEGDAGAVGDRNAAITAATGDYVCFLDGGHLLEPDALYEVAQALADKPSAVLAYCDEDELSRDGTFVSPFFKPDFNLDRLCAQYYLGNFLCARRQALMQVEPSAPRHEGVQRHDIALKMAELSTEAVHVRKVLCHHVGGSAPDGAGGPVAPNDARLDEASCLTVREHLERRGIAAKVSPEQWPGVNRIAYEVQGQPLVSIVIPNKDASTLLERCVGSILEKTAYGHYEIIVVDNNSSQPETPACYQRLEQRDGRVRVIEWPAEFNYSKITNFGVGHSAGEYVVLLNNDTEVIADTWLEDMLGCCQRDEVGAVGARLLFRNGALQHVGVVLDSPQRPACHLYTLLPASHPGYFLQAALPSDYSAVTAACMMTKRSAYDAVGGLDEKLAVLYNDVDFCLKLRERGLLIVYEPSVLLYHYESSSRGDDYDTPEKRQRAEREARLFYSRWRATIDAGDPYFNPNLEPPYARLRAEATLRL